jgi:Flp pilus assembly protein TadG
MKRRMRRASAADRGATVVEFALLLPVLLLLVFGIIDFGRALNAQVTITQAAREGARLDALNQPNVISRTKAAATGLSASVTVTEVTTCPAGSGPTANADVQVSYGFNFITPIGAIAKLFGGGKGPGSSPLTLTAQGVMPCET